MKKVSTVNLTTYQESVAQALDEIEAYKILEKQKKIIIKPNLVNNSPPPVTTDVRMIKALIDYIKKYSEAKIIIAEGSAGCDAGLVYKSQGYEELVTEDVSLIDLDKEKSIIKLNKDLPLLKEIYLPAIILDGFLISAPTLKQHGITGVTLGIKNMVGILPRSYYQGFWVFRKSKIHKYNIHQGVADISFYRPIDLTIVDGGVGLSRGHLFGKPFDPPKKVIVAGLDSLETDIKATIILEKNPKEIKHLRCYQNNLTRIEKQKPRAKL